MEMAVLKSSETKKVEKTTTKLWGVSEAQMIVQAGFAVYSEVQEFSADLQLKKQQPWIIICGTGHNGADGLQCGLFALEKGLPLQIFQVHSDKGYSKETLQLQRQLKANGHPIGWIKKASDLKFPHETGLIVDALLGSGLPSPPRPLMKKLIEKVNQSGLPVFSIDVPSGISTDGAFFSEPIKARATLSLGGANISAFFHPTLAYYGKLNFSTLCFSENLLRAQASKTTLFTEDNALTSYPLPGASTHKYQAGKVLVLAGSKGMHGAAFMAATSALKAGAGLVKLAVPGGVYGQMGKRLTEVIGCPVGTAQTQHFNENHLFEVQELMDWCDVIIMGPGMGRDKHTVSFIQGVLANAQRPIVLDGDGLSCFYNKKIPKRKKSCPLVVTPHEGEYTRMGGKYSSDDPWKHVKNAQNFARDKNLHLVLKGPTNLFASPEGECTLLPRGNPGFATAGTGDVLSGILGAFLCKTPPATAAKLGVALHSLAGNRASQKKGTRGMIATDIIKYIPVILADWEQKIKNTTI